MLTVALKDNVVLQAAVCLFLSLLAYALIYGGLAFLNRRLFPAHLDVVYAHTGDVSRMLVFLLLAAAPANYLLAKTFEISSAAVAGAAILAAIVVVTVANAVILDGARLTLPVLAATGLAIFSCSLVSWLLVMQK